MAEVGIDDGVLRVRLSTAEKLLALHGRDIEVPLTEITAIETVEEIYGQLRGLRLPGTGLPGVLAIGTWRGRADGEAFHDFALIHRRGPGVVVATNGGDYARILLSTDDPQAMVDALKT
jgi:hypothetical protein